MSPGTVTIVMYHYVRPIAASPWPRIKGLELSRFQGQLDYIQRHYNPISMEHLVAASAGAANLPVNPILLTFDDGYSDHYHYAFKELSARRIPGAFFPPACALIDRTILDVNRIHYILAAVEDTAMLAGMLDRAILDAAGEFNLPSLAELRRAAAHTSRWDTPEVSYIKRMLQDGLTGPLRRRLIDELFAEFVSADPLSFADELYMNAEHAREMVEYGMHIGSHGERHERLSLMDAQSQRREIADSLRIFPAMGRSPKGFTFCYPYGDYDSRTVQVLAELGCLAAVTTKVALAEAGSSALLELPRINTNDLPVADSAAPNEWTRAAER